MARKLTPRQQIFVLEYLKDFSCTQAALRAGYTRKSPNAAGAKLLSYPNVQEAIRAEVAKRAERVQAKADDVIRELMRIAFADITTIARVVGGAVVVSDTEGIPENTRRAIAEISQNSGTGRVAVKLHDKLKALELLGRHIGMWKDRHVLENPDGSAVTFILPPRPDNANS